MRRFLCWLGWHHWWVDCTYSVHEKGRVIESRRWRECSACGKVRAA